MRFNGAFEIGAYFFIYVSMYRRTVRVNSLFNEIRVMFRAESLRDPRTTARWGAKEGFLAYTLAAWMPIPRPGDCPTKLPVRAISWEYPGSDFWQQQRAYCNGHFVTFALSFPMGVVPPLLSKLLLFIPENLDVLKDKLWRRLNWCEKQSLFVEGDSEILGCENQMSRELVWHSEREVNKILGYYVTRNICNYGLRLAFLHWNRGHM